MAAITKNDIRLKQRLVANTDHSIHAGLVPVEAMARRFDLWNKLRKLPCLDPRKDRKRGYGPEVTVGQLIYAPCSGGGCLSDSEPLNAHQILLPDHRAGVCVGEQAVGLERRLPELAASRR